MSCESMISNAIKTQRKQSHKPTKQTVEGTYWPLQHAQFLVFAGCVTKP
jgi:hypothetical protein